MVSKILQYTKINRKTFTALILYKFFYLRFYEEINGEKVYFESNPLELAVSRDRVSNILKALESVKYDVIKICLKGGMREVGKETPKKEMDNRLFL